jgi:hypothetical protein
VRGRTSVDDRHRGHPVEFTHRGTHVNVVAVVRHHHDLRQHAVILDLRLAQLRNEHRCMHSEHRPSREANIGTGAERGSTRTGGQLFAISTSLAAKTDTRYHQVNQLAAGSAVPRCGELAAAGSGGGRRWRGRRRRGSGPLTLALAQRLHRRPVAQRDLATLHHQRKARVEVVHRGGLLLRRHLGGVKASTAADSRVSKAGRWADRPKNSLVKHFTVFLPGAHSSESNEFGSAVRTARTGVRT